MVTAQLKSVFKITEDFGRSFVRERLRRRPYQVDPKLKSIVKEVARNSYAMIPGYYNAEQCAALRADLDRLIQKHATTGHLWVDPVGADHRVFGAEVDSTLVQQFFADPFLLSAAENYFGGAIVNSNTLAARVEAKEKNIGSGQGWHRDGNHFQFKAMIYLSDVDENHGPFQIFKGSHRASKVIRHTLAMRAKALETRYQVADIEALIANTSESPVALTAPAGTLLFVDTSAIHRGMPIREGNRYALTNYYYPSYENVEDRRKQFNAIKRP